jgi:hypothetical protein
MTLMGLRHESRIENRESIKARGLECHQPYDDGNYPGMTSLEDQPRGVYACPVGGNEPSGFEPWMRSYQDSWTFYYCGPALNDPLITGAVVCVRPIPPEHLECAPADEEELMFDPSNLKLVL